MISQRLDVTLEAFSNLNCSVTHGQKNPPFSNDRIVEMSAKLLWLTHQHLLQSLFSSTSLSFIFDDLSEDCSALHQSWRFFRLCCALQALHYPLSWFQITLGTSQFGRSKCIVPDTFYLNNYCIWNPVPKQVTVAGYSECTSGTSIVLFSSPNPLWTQTQNLTHFQCHSESPWTDCYSQKWNQIQQIESTSDSLLPWGTGMTTVHLRWEALITPLFSVLLSEMPSAFPPLSHQPKKSEPYFAL